MAAVASETFTSTSAPIQYAAIRAFEGGTEIENYLAHSRRVLRHLGRHVWRSLRDAGVIVSEPVGGFYLFPDFSPLRERLAQRGITGSASLCERLLEETGVAALPGVEFGRPPAELTLRLAYVDFDGARALAAAQQVPLDQELDRSFLDLYCPNVMKATAAIVRWLKKPAERKPLAPTIKKLP
jgi:aspartate aminotransferase